MSHQMFLCDDDPRDNVKVSKAHRPRHAVFLSVGRPGYIYGSVLIGTAKTRDLAHALLRLIGEEPTNIPSVPQTDVLETG